MSEFLFYKRVAGLLCLYMVIDTAWEPYGVLRVLAFFILAHIQIAMWSKIE